MNYKDVIEYNKEDDIKVIPILITRRDYFAGLAFQSLLNNSLRHSDEANAQLSAESVILADALIKKLDEVEK